MRSHFSFSPTLYYSITLPSGNPFKYHEMVLSLQPAKQQCYVIHVWKYKHVRMYGHTYSKSMDQPGKVASPARGQLNRKNEYFPVRVRA